MEGVYCICLIEVLRVALDIFRRMNDLPVSQAVRKWQRLTTRADIIMTELVPLAFSYFGLEDEVR